MESFKGDLSRNVGSIRHAPDKLFQNSVGRLLKAASRIFRDPEAGVLFVIELSYENTNAAHCSHPAIQSKDRLIWIYSSLCRNWTLIQSVSLRLLPCSGLQYKQCFHTKLIRNVSSINLLKKDCPKIRGIDRQSNCSPGICPHCRRDNLWARTLAICSDYI